MYFQILIALIFLVDSNHALFYKIYMDEYNIAGTPMQFNVSVSDTAWPFFYKFDLSENVMNKSVSRDDYKQISYSFLFPKDTKPGKYRLKVQVYFMFDLVKIMKINGPDGVDFEIKDKLSGNITYTQANLLKRAYKRNHVACFNVINFVSEIHDFHQYFKNVDYKWFINGSLIQNATAGRLNYTLDKEDIYNITSKFNATSIDNQTTTGSSELKVTAFKPLSGLNLTGIPNISWKRNKDLEIYVNFINGSKPFWYCYNIIQREDSKLVCLDPDETTQDFFKVRKRFSRNGTYYLNIKAGNSVTHVQKSFPISVIDFEKKSQIMVFIIPIVSIIFIMAVLLSGVLYHIKNKNKFITEVADFNFEKSQVDCLSEETFFQRLTNTFKSSIDSAFNREETQTKRLINVDNCIEDD